MDGIEILKLLPPGASVTAVLFVVMIFIKFLKEMLAEHRTTIERLTETYTKNSSEDREQYNNELKEARNYFSQQIKEIGDRFTQAVDRLQSELRQRITDREKQQ